MCDLALKARDIGRILGSVKDDRFCGFANSKWTLGNHFFSYHGTLVKRSTGIDKEGSLLRVECSPIVSSLS